MGLPPIKRHGKSMYPRFCSWPMGYKLSAAVAQSIANRVASDARLPLGHRLRPGVSCPRGPPVEKDQSTLLSTAGAPYFNK